MENFKIFEHFICYKTFQFVLFANPISRLFLLTVLYIFIQGYISYPRTETNQYPENYNLKEQIVKQKSSSAWGGFVNKLLNEKGIQKPRKGNDCGDHPPITPMRVASEAELGGDLWRIYSYIVRHFIATVITHFNLYTNTQVHFTQS